MKKILEILIPGLAVGLLLGAGMYGFNHKHVIHQAISSFNKQAVAPTVSVEVKKAVATITPSVTSTPVFEDSFTNSDLTGFYSEVNTYRAEKGVKPLAISSNLEASAREESEDVITGNAKAFSISGIATMLDQSSNGVSENILMDIEHNNIDNAMILTSTYTQIGGFGVCNPNIFKQGSGCVFALDLK